MAEYNSIHTGQEVDQAITNIGTHLVDTSNPHGVTKAQVGLENVDNTSDANKPISTATQTALDAKQATLVSGTNIKTINNQTILGSGNIDIGGSGLVYSVNGKTGTVVLDATDVHALPDSTSIPTKTSDLTNDSGFIDSSYHDSTKQDTLVSGINIKTINSTSILGSGNLEVKNIYVGDTAPTGDEEFWLDTSEDGFTPSEMQALIAAHNIDTNAHQDIRTLVSGKQDTIADLETIRSGASAGASAYQLPQTGVPITDLASGIQTSLGLADTALQSGDVPQWALQPTKPTYTKEEVGLGNVENKSGATIRSEMTSLEVTTALGFTPEDSSNKSSAITSSSTDTQYASAKAVYDYHDATKQDVISDLDAIRSGATAGSTAVQPSAISDMATKTWVGSQGYLTEHQSLADYSTTAQMNAAISAHHDSTKLDATLKGAANGLAELGNDGKVPTAQLPSYVDDVVEGYYYNNKFYSDSAHTQEITPETGKIYVDLHTNKTYRWGGSTYVEISASLTLGETETTAYRGDRGKTAYEHSLITSGNPHFVTFAELRDRPTQLSQFTDNLGSSPIHTHSQYLTEHQSLADYSTTAQMNTAIANHHDSTKQDTISDLTTIRSGATAGATALQPNDNVSSLTNDAGYITSASISDKEDKSNKVNTITGNESDTDKYPSTKAIADYHDSTKQNIIDASHLLSADLVADGTTNKVVTASEKSTWSGKQDAISDLASIRSGAGLGATSVQPGDNVSTLINDAGYLTTASISGKEDVANKSNSYTVSSETTYASTKALVDGLSTKQDTISDLSTIRSGASAGATAVQPAAISDMATQTWTTTQIQNSLILTDTVTSKRYRFVITNGVLGISEVE